MASQLTSVGRHQFYVRAYGLEAFDCQLLESNLFHESCRCSRRLYVRAYPFVAGCGCVPDA